MCLEKGLVWCVTLWEPHIHPIHPDQPPQSSAEQVETDADLTEVTKAEIYVRCISSKNGLACWQPRPRKPYAGEHGVVAGDVGTFSAGDGFRKIFNIWEDQEEIKAARLVSQSGYAPPKMAVATHQEELSEGDTVVHGTSSNTQYTSDGE